MRTSSRFLALIIACLTCVPAICAQINPPPPDPHEMVTRQPTTLSKATDRNTAINLLARARRNYNLHTIPLPSVLKVSFETSGSAQIEGAGTMEELFDGKSLWRWTAQLQQSAIIRMGVTGGRTYGTNPSEPVPLRVQLIRAALHWAVAPSPGSAEIRSASVESDGKELTCLLLSGSPGVNPPPRAWVENESCIESATGLLKMWSEAPGIYAEYDYNGSTDFHGHTFPKLVSIFEDGRLTVTVHVVSLEDAPNLDPNAFKPSPEMGDSSGTFQLGVPDRFPMRVDPSNAPASPRFQPVIVHATLDAQDGHVLDAETLQNSNPELSRAALNLLKDMTFPASGFQEEVFINLQFHLPGMGRRGMPTETVPMSVQWVIANPRNKVPPGS
jgi:hypothetical protein